MSRVVFMCGPAGSGKSTYSRQLEAQGMTRLSFDSVAWERGLTDMPLPEEVRADIERELDEQLYRLVKESRDVVLDRSFHSKQMRERYRKLLAPYGVIPEMVYLTTDRATLLGRLRDRLASYPYDFALSEELAAHHFDHSEVPKQDDWSLHFFCIEQNRVV